MAQISFYFDEMISRDVEKGLATRGIRVIMAVDAGMMGKADPEHLQAATELGAVLVTLDRPFAGLTSKQTNHAGLICWTGLHSDIGGMVNRLVEFARNLTLEDVADHIFWLK